VVPVCEVEHDANVEVQAVLMGKEYANYSPLSTAALPSHGMRHCMSDTPLHDSRKSDSYAPSQSPTRSNSMVLVFSSPRGQQAPDHTKNVPKPLLTSPSKRALATGASSTPRPQGVEDPMQPLVSPRPVTRVASRASRLASASMGALSVPRAHAQQRASSEVRAAVVTTEVAGRPVVGSAVADRDASRKVVPLPSPVVPCRAEREPVSKFIEEISIVSAPEIEQPSEVEEEPPIRAKMDMDDAELTTVILEQSFAEMEIPITSPAESEPDVEQAPITETPLVPPGKNEELLRRLPGIKDRLEQIIAKDLPKDGRWETAPLLTSKGCHAAMRSTSASNAHLSRQEFCKTHGLVAMALMIESALDSALSDPMEFLEKDAIRKREPVPRLDQPLQCA